MSYEPNRQSADLTPVIDFLAKDRKVKFAYLFGSRARGEAGSLSDTDIAIYLDRRVKPGRYRLKLMEALAKVLKTDDLDLVVLNHATPLLRHEVIKYGRPLKDDALLRVPFEADALREYLDTAHLRQIQRSALAESIRKGETFGPERARRRQARKTS